MYTNLVVFFKYLLLNQLFRFLPYFFEPSTILLSQLLKTFFLL